MASYTIMVLASVVVEARDLDQARTKALTPFHYGAIPQVARTVIVGQRLAKLGDRPGESAEADARFLAETSNPPRG